ncbi:MAG TPA: uroporphyrinogen decarboxylase family protein [Phycisphaerae bacterium]|nr:uroporphyrinogen decarboxylase family protein [Phycisphaerae bacterium]
MTSKERCLNAIAGESVDRVPVFPLLMFFAVDRAKITYRQYATEAAALADAQLNMRWRFGVDAITVCSDAFRLSADLGGEMDYPEMAPPRLVRPLVGSEADLKRLSRPDPTAKGGRMADRVEGVRRLADAAGDECLVLGWIDMPFAEACAICGITEFMMLLADDPALAHKVLEFLTPLVIDFTLAQVEAGAPMVGAGDAAASLISPRMYREFVLPYEQRVCEAVRERGGTIKLHICGNTNLLLPDMARCGADLFNVDHMVDLGRAADVYSRAGKCFKGNLDPVTDMLQSTPDRCRQRALECIHIAAGRPYMLSAGCEVPAGVSDETFRAFCETPLQV